MPGTELAYGATRGGVWGVACGVSSSLCCYALATRCASTGAQGDTETRAVVWHGWYSIPP
eukprot:1268616-Rhodomonas_salina.1